MMRKLILYYLTTVLCFFVLITNSFSYTSLSNYGDMRNSFVESAAELGDLLVIYTARDADAIQPYIQWKLEKGFTVHVQEVDTGTNVKSIVQQRYSTNPDLMYVQLVGDWQDIKSDVDPDGDGAPNDPQLGCVTGNGLYPDLAVGRFSGNNSEQITIQVNKTIEYEKNPELDGDWYSKALGIAVPGDNGDDGETDSEHLEVIKNYKLLEHTYTEVFGLYERTDADIKIINYVNSGLGLINYSGHGSPYGWSEFSFTSTDVNRVNSEGDREPLINNHKLPIITSLACDTGAFHKLDESFAEALLRKENGGAVTALMCSKGMGLHSGMVAQDYMMDLLTGGYDYSENPGRGTSTDQGNTIFGKIIINSFAMSDDSDRWEQDVLKAWTIFGDCTLQVRTSAPLAFDVSNTAAAVGRPFTTTITSEQGPVDDAWVTLQQDGQVYTGFTSADGTVTIDHSLTDGAATLVVSGYNLDTHYYNLTLNSTPVPPAANFSATPVSGTAPLTVTFSDLSSGDLTQWIWDFGDGSSSYQQNPSSHIYTTAGTYTVSLEVSNSEGNALETKTGFITVEQAQNPEPVDYCEASGSDNEFEFIQQIDVGTEIYASGASGYSDFKDQVFNVIIGDDTDIVLTPGHALNPEEVYWRVWIDFNYDYDFEDEGELVFEASGEGIIEGSLQIPESAASVSAVMRVSMGRDHYTEPCDTFTYGEVEDYTVVLADNQPPTTPGDSNGNQTPGSDSDGSGGGGGGCFISVLDI